MKKIDYIKIAKKSSAIQISELKKINKVFNKSFLKVIDAISNCKGKLISAGIGKSGLIARKISATLSSVGIPSFYLNPSEANHGDLGQIDKNDILLIFSYSGNTSEINGLLKYANRFNIKVIGVASKEESMLLKASTLKILLPKVKESDPTQMVPTTSTSLTLLFGDCLAVALMHKKKFSKEKFKLFHPGGNIGQSLLLAKDIMIKGKKLPTIVIQKRLKDALQIIDSKKLGLVVILKNKIIKGIITDGDLRREMKNYSKNVKLEKIMSINPMIISEETLASKALSIMNDKKITSLLIASEKDLMKKGSAKLRGIIHIHSLLKYGIK